GRAIVEDTEIGPISRQRTGERERRGQELASDTETLGTGSRLKLSPRQPSAVYCTGQPTPISVAEDRGVQDIDRFVIEPFENRARNVKVGIVDQNNRAQIRP